MDKPTFKTSSYNGSTTLAGQLKRIKDYVAQLKDLAAYLGETEKEGLLKDLFAKVDKGEDVDLQQITAALLEISNKVPTLDGADVNLGSTKHIVGKTAAQTILIPAGYYGDDVTFTVESLEDSSKVEEGKAAQPSDLLNGMEAWVNGEKITGTSTTDLTDKAPNSTVYVDSNGETEGGTLQINLNSTDNTANDKFVETGIPFNPALADTITVKKVLTSETGDTATVAESITVKAGYYPEDVIIKAKVEDAEGNVEEVLNVNELSVTGKVEFAEGSNSYTYKPDTDGLDYYTLVTLAKAVLSDQNETTGGRTVATAGWLNSDVELGGLNEGSYHTEAYAETTAEDGVTIVDGNAVIKKNAHGYTPDTITAALPVSSVDEKQTGELTFDKGKAVFTKTVTIPAGYYETTNVVVTGETDLEDDSILGTHTFDAAGTSVSDDDKAGNDVVTISSQYVKDTLSTGYYTEETKVFKVQDLEFEETGSVDSSKGLVTIPVKTAGWRAADVTFTMPTQQAATEFTPDKLGSEGNNNSIAAGTYLTGAVTVKAVDVDNTNVTYNEESDANIANAEGAKVSTVSEGNATKFYDTVDLSALLTEMAAV